jgi:predicted ferric reductase
VLAELNPQVAWYAARSSGVVAWALVTAGILWGLALSTRLIRKRGVPAWLLDLHRFLGTLSLVFVGVHLVSLWADSYLVFAWSELFVPMASAYRPGAVAWGIVATYLLVAVEVTSWLMRRLPRRAWHTIHLSSFLLFITATVHGFQAGADRTTLVVQWLALTGFTLVMFLLLFRLLAPRRQRAQTRSAGRQVAAAAATATTSSSQRPPSREPRPPARRPTAGAAEELVTHPG